MAVHTSADWGIHSALHRLKGLCGTRKRNADTALASSLNFDRSMAEAASAGDRGIEYPRRLQRAETILARRTSRLVLVLEHGHDLGNQHAILRSAECFGIQHVWLVRSPIGLKNAENQASGIRGNLHPEVLKISKQAASWIDVRTFNSTAECVEAMRADGREIWVTELSQKSEALELTGKLHVPDRLAIVMGRELDGVSEEMIRAADKLVHLPMHGWTESFNLSVASALTLQRLFDICPEMRGSLQDAERNVLRARWYDNLAKTEGQKDEYQRWLGCPPPPFADLRRSEELRQDWCRPTTTRKNQRTPCTAEGVQHAKSKHEASQIPLSELQTQSVNIVDPIPMDRKEALRDLKAAKAACNAALLQAYKIGASLSPDDEQRVKLLQARASRIREQVTS